MQTKIQSFVVDLFKCTWLFVPPDIKSSCSQKNEKEIITGALRRPCDRKGGQIFFQRKTSKEGGSAYSGPKSIGDYSFKNVRGSYTQKGGHVKGIVMVRFRLPYWRGLQRKTVQYIYSLLFIYLPLFLW